MSTATDGLPRPPSTPRKKSLASTTQGEDATDYCRICRGEATTEQPLFYPCKCSGSIKFVHQDCLMEWLSHSQKKYCELCKTPFRFTKLYDQSMPDTVPFFLFLRQVTIHAVRAVGRWLRYFLVVFVWLFWLPWTIRQIWRGLFWIADGSWMTAEELRRALRATSPQAEQEQHNIPENLVAVSAFGNVRLDGSLARAGTFSSLVSALSPARWVFRIGKWIWLTANDTASDSQAKILVNESMTLSTPMPRQPSLLSEVGAIKAVTRYPLLNNAVIDVFEGQLVCILVIAAFILIFLIREWVINQQPIPEMPDPDQRENIAQPAVPVEQARPIVRRRRRGLRRLADAGAQLENHAAEPAQRPEAPPQPRRAATDNNIILLDGHGQALIRPEAPVRAASLVDGLQEMENFARQLGMPPESSSEEVQVEDVQSPPLQRGAFDDLTHVSRNIDDSIARNSFDEPFAQSSLFSQPSSPEPEDSIPVADASSETFMFGAASLNAAYNSQTASGEFTFRLPSQSSTNLIEIDPPSIAAGSQDGAQLSSEADWALISNDELTTVIAEPDEVIPNAATDSERPAASVASNDPSDVASATSPAGEEPQTVWDKLAQWLWHTDEYIPPPPTLDVDDDTDIVQDVQAEPPFVPVRNGNRGDEAQNRLAAEPVQGEAEPVNQPGADPNDPNAADADDDIEGILELIGMEGPIAGMIQNIIFSVFLITLTLSASIWCPYIWGKIALLFLANPVGVFIRAPLYLISRTADVIVDIGLFMLGAVGFFLNHLTKVIKLLSAPVLPALSRFLNTDLLEDMALKLSENSFQRLEKTLSGTLFGLRPDLPTFSMQSHHAMRVFKAALSDLGFDAFEALSKLAMFRPSTPTVQSLLLAPVTLGKHILVMWTNALTTATNVKEWFNVLSHNLKPVSFVSEEAIDYSLVSWSTQEKIVCILLGYTFFAIAGFAYLKIAERIMGLREDEKVDGFLADVLRQAGGVLKVVVIIGIEMIVFPLYCGIMLDLALLPLFEGASPLTRLTFLVNSPVTALFIHWFIGTCYMFHFALFVSMCRKVMRKGVLYFIRDPDDPAFHPVRDVLERPVATQLGKIAFSAFIYGGLLIVCLGGVVLGISYVGSILPIHWSSHEPRSAFPTDVIFFNMMLPFILRKVEISTKISNMYEWWFRGIASGLRLTHFLFGVEREEERRPAMIAWRSALDVLLHNRSPLLPERDGFTLRQNPFANAEGGTICVERVLGIISSEILREKFSAFGQIVDINIPAEQDCGFVQFADIHHADIVCKSCTGEFTFKDGTFQVHRTSELDHKLIASGKLPPKPFDGSWVRAPATDSVRIPKGTLVFLEVNENNERLDGKEDTDVGLHGKKDDRFKKLYIPPNFRARISTFIALVWLFAATTGVSFTLGPLLIGRKLLIQFTKPEGQPNDLYAFTIGLHVFGAVVLATVFVLGNWRHGWMRSKEIATNTRELLPRAYTALKYVFGLTYMVIAFGIILPFTISLLSELYLHIPLYTYLLADQQNANVSDPPTRVTLSDADSASEKSTLTLINIPVVYIFQTWTLGFVYLRLLLRVFSNYPDNNTQAAVAIRGILRNGILQPDVKLATRAFILPVMTISIFMLISPVLIARGIVAFFSVTADDRRAAVYRHVYPSLLALIVGVFTLVKLKKRIEGWRSRIRDEVYLIGERLHNFQNERAEGSKANKGKVVERQQESSAAPNKSPESQVEQSTSKTIESSTKIELQQGVLPPRSDSLNSSMHPQDGILASTSTAQQNED